MGTNYYAQTITEICDHCGRGTESEKVHIGKSSAGWCFALHVYPERGIYDLDDWVREWNKAGSVITNEYGEVKSPAEMLDTITKRAWPNKPDHNAQFLRDNHAVEGPNGLMRHEIGSYCLGHGAGTWDRMVHEFS